MGKAGSDDLGSETFTTFTSDIRLRPPRRCSRYRSAPSCHGSGVGIDEWMHHESNLRRQTHSLCKSVHPQIFLGKLQATKLSKASLGHWATNYKDCTANALQEVWTTNANLCSGTWCFQMQSLNLGLLFLDFFSVHSEQARSLPCLILLIGLLTFSWMQMKHRLIKACLRRLEEMSNCLCCWGGAKPRDSRMLATGRRQSCKMGSSFSVLSLWPKKFLGCQKMSKVN